MPVLPPGTPRECICPNHINKPYDDGCPIHRRYLNPEETPMSKSDPGAMGHAIADADQRRVEREFCTCPGDPSASAAGWNASCPVHGETPVTEAYGKTTDELAAEAEMGYPVVRHPDGTTQTLREWARGREPEPTGYYAAQVAEEAIRLFTGPRNGDYGDATANFTDIADLWTVVLRPILQPGAQLTAEQVAIMSALIKVARLNTTPDHDDSWTDATAYLALGAGINRRRQV